MPAGSKKLLDGSSVMHVTAMPKLITGCRRRTAIPIARIDSNTMSPGSWREAVALRDLDLRRTVLRREMRRPEEKSHPLRHDTDRREHAIAIR